jgi:NitT/TauT family transport system substrate-binding protein
MLDNSAIDRYPSNGFLALEETLRARRKDAVGLARAYAKGTIFTISNPEAAVRIFYEVFPSQRPTGKDEATALRDELKVLEARIPKLKLETGGVKRWGENSEKNYAEYADFLFKWGVVTQKVNVNDLITNELIDEINKFDATQIVAMAKAYKAK